MSTDVDPTPPTTLRGYRPFQLLWVADAISQHGAAAVTAVIPLLAATTLHAGPLQMGVLAAADMVAFLVLGLPAGAWIDRLRRRPVLIAADLTRAVLLLALPIAGWLGALTIVQLIVVATVLGAATMFFDIAYQAYLPAVIGTDNLAAGYANLSATQSIAQAAGPGLGGLLVQVAGAVNALAGTALGYLNSAVLLSRIRVPEPAPSAPAGRGKLRIEVAEGLRFVVTHPQLRALTIVSAMAGFFNAGVLALEVLFFSRGLGLSGLGAGLMLAVSGVGSVLGAAVTGWCSRRVGPGRALWLVPLLTWPAHVLVPLARPGAGVVLAVAGLVVFAFGATVYNVLSMSRRQAVTPDRLRGRVNASMRFVIWGSMPLGAIVAGVLAERWGIRAAMWIATTGTALAVLPLFATSLRAMSPGGKVS